MSALTAPLLPSSETCFERSMLSSTLKKIDAGQLETTFRLVGLTYACSTKIRSNGEATPRHPGSTESLRREADDFVYSHRLGVEPPKLNRWER